MLRAASRAAGVVPALAIVCSATGSAQPASDSPAAVPSGPGTIVLQGEAFALSGDLCQALLASSRSGERLWISPSCCVVPPAPDPLAACGTPVEHSLLDAGALDAGDDPARCERLRRAGAIVLTGGTYLDWYELFTPREKRSGMCAALFEAQREGALLVASGAAAAILADWAIVDRAALNRLRRNPRDVSEHTLVQGLSLVPGATIEASGAPLAELARWLALATRGPSSWALYLEGQVAWIMRDEPQPRVQIEGPGAVLVLDLHTARRQHRSLRGGRISLCGDGDRWDARTRAVPTATQALEPGATQRLVTPTPGELRGAAALAEVLRREFTPAQATTVRFSLPTLKLSLHADSESRFGNGAREKYAARAGIAFDLEWDAPSNP